MRKGMVEEPAFIALTGLLLVGGFLIGLVYAAQQMVR